MQQTADSRIVQRPREGSVQAGPRGGAVNTVPKYYNYCTK